MTVQREYFYEIDPAGWLYHDNSRLTDKKFLDFFFKRVRRNPGPAYTEYAYQSPCGPEMNYIRCHDTPFVFTDLRQDQLILNHSDLSVGLNPTQLRLNPLNDCLYHPARAELYGRLHTKVQLELASYIQEKDGQYSIALADGIYPIVVEEEFYKS